MALKSMTCLAVIKDSKGKLLFAADRRISWSFGKAQSWGKPKISKRGGILFAGTGSAYLCSLLVDLMPVPPVPENMSTYDYMHGVFFDRVVEFLSRKKLLDKDELRLFGDKKDEDKPSAVILIGMRGELFELDLDTNGLGIDLINTPYAHGCGGPIAWGALLGIEHTQKLLKKLKIFGSEAITDEDRLRMALESAAQVSPGCDNVIDILRESD